MTPTEAKKQIMNAFNAAMKLIYPSLKGVPKPVLRQLYDKARSAYDYPKVYAGFIGNLGQDDISKKDLYEQLAKHISSNKALNDGLVDEWNLNIIPRHEEEGTDTQAMGPLTFNGSYTPPTATNTTNTTQPAPPGTNTTNTTPPPAPPNPPTTSTHPEATPKKKSAAEEEAERQHDILDKRISASRAATATMISDAPGTRRNRAAAEAAAATNKANATKKRKADDMQYQGERVSLRAFREAIVRIYPKLKSAKPEHILQLYNSNKDVVTAAFTKFQATYAASGDKHGPTQNEMYEWYTRDLGAKDGLQASIVSEWNNSILPTYEREVGTGASPGKLEATEKYTPDPTFQNTPMGNYNRATLNANQAQAGQYVEGLGVKNMDGTFGRGSTTNVAGGRLDTQVGENKVKGGDVITRGPQSSDAATKTLRPKFGLAGGEDLKQHYDDNLQSDALFEAFSWVPDGYGLGSHNRLHLQNKQNDSIRYGMEQLYEPRGQVESGMPHQMHPGWIESMPLDQLERIYVEKVGKEMMERQAMDHETVQPSHVLDNDYNRQPSYKGLQRQAQGPSPYQTVVDNMRAFLPARDPPGYYMNSLPYQDTRRGSMGMRRLNAFNSLMR